MAVRWGRARPASGRGPLQRAQRHRLHRLGDEQHRHRVGGREQPCRETGHDDRADQDLAAALGVGQGTDTSSAGITSSVYVAYKSVTPSGERDRRVERKQRVGQIAAQKHCEYSEPRSRKWRSPTTAAPRLAGHRPGATIAVNIIRRGAVGSAPGLMRVDVYSASTASFWRFSS